MKNCKELIILYLLGLTTHLIRPQGWNDKSLSNLQIYHEWFEFVPLHLHSSCFMCFHSSWQKSTEALAEKELKCTTLSGLIINGRHIITGRGKDVRACGNIKLTAGRSYSSFFVHSKFPVAIKTEYQNSFLCTNILSF